tara:strand:- start:1007 stop:1483 length:477 start_codon:yes stop_codon:yes gene_type:complete
MKALYPYDALGLSLPHRFELRTLLDPHRERMAPEERMTRRIGTTTRKCVTAAQMLNTKRVIFLVDTPEQTGYEVKRIQSYFEKLYPAIPRHYIRVVPSGHALVAPNTERHVLYVLATPNRDAVGKVLSHDLYQGYEVIADLSSPSFMESSHDRQSTEA